MLTNIIELNKLLDSMIPNGWQFYTCDASTDKISVMLKRDIKGKEWWHSLPEDIQELTALHVNGSGLTFGDAVMAAVKFIKDGCGI